MAYWVIPWHCLVVFLGIRNVGVKFEVFPSSVVEAIGNVTEAFLGPLLRHCTVTLALHLLPLDCTNLPIVS